MRRLRSSIVLVVASLMLVAPTGCSLVARVTGGFEDPALELQGSKVESVSPDVTRLLFTLVVHNPNAFPLESRVHRYRLTIDKTVVAEGTSNILATIPSSAPALLDVPIEVGPGSLSNAAPRAVVLGEIPYDLDVWLSIDAWLHPREVHLATSSVRRLNYRSVWCVATWLPSRSRAGTARSLSRDHSDSSRHEAVGFARE